MSNWGCHSTLYRIGYHELEQLTEQYKTSLPQVKQLRVGEVSYKRRHHYASFVTDYNAGKVLLLEKGRSQPDLERAYDILSVGLSEVDKATMDFWRAFGNATQKHLPNAAIIYDHFHIARLLKVV